MAKIVIIGAGLTGLSTAYHLEKNNFYDYVIFEKEATIGGLCKSVYQNGFTFDFTGHLLHINDAYFRSFIDEVMGFDNLHTHTRNAFIFSHDTFTPYPFQRNLYGLPRNIIAECIESFATRPNINQTKTYYQWVLKHFGKGFGNHFLYPYQKKLLDYDIHKLSARWVGRFIPKTSLKEIIQGALQKRHETEVGYNAAFFYPKSGGIFSFIKKLASKIENPIHTNMCAQKIDLKNKIVRFKNGHTEKFDYLINTMPLNVFLNSLEEKSATSLQKAANKLICNSVVNFNLGISHSPQNAIKNDPIHWIYFPEKQFPFYRLGFYNHFSPSMAPSGCSSLYGELSYYKKSKKHVSEKLEHAIEACKKQLNIDNRDIITEKTITIDHAYVIYNFWREKHINHIHKRLHEHGVYSIGRYGYWKYSSMQEAVLDGKSIVDKLLVAQEKKYWHSISEETMKAINKEQ